MRASRPLTLLTLLFAASVAHACSCMRVGPVCSRFSDYDAIFRGTVADGHVVPDYMTVKNPDGTTTQLRGNGTVVVRFAVKEELRGAEGTRELTVRTSEQGSACGYPFQRGTDYLVFAYKDRETGLLQTNACAGNRVLTEEQAASDVDVQWLRSLPTLPPGASISGTATTADGKPLAGISVTASGPQIAPAVTDKQGGFQMPGLPPGAYTVTADTPPGFLEFSSDKITLEDRGCAVEPIRFEYDSHVRGRVTNELGNAVGKMSLSLRPAGQPEHSGGVLRISETKADGTYDFDKLWPGTYWLEVNQLGPQPYPPQFYGGSDEASATPIAVGPSASVDGINIVLPAPWPTVQVPVTVVNAKGAPAADVWIDHTDEGYRNFIVPGVSTDSNGKAMLPVYVGHNYRIQARQAVGSKLRCSETMHLSASPDTAPLTLQVAGKCDVP